MKLTTNNYYANKYIEAAKKLKINYQVEHSNGLIKLSKGGITHYFHRANPDINSSVSTQLCSNKYLTVSLLAQNHLPTPKQIIITKSSKIIKSLKNLPLPSVIKPSNGISGKDVFVNIKTKAETIKITQSLLTKYNKIIIESFEEGDYYRFLVFDKKVIGIVNRVMPKIIGDGITTIESLIKNLPSFNRISINDSLKNTLKKSGYFFNDILDKNKEIAIRSNVDNSTKSISKTPQKKMVIRLNAGYSTGGISTTLRNYQFHKDLLDLAIKAAEITHTRLAGVDLLIKDPKKSIKNNAVVIEINHNPGSKMHYNPDVGQIQDVATIILKGLFNI